MANPYDSLTSETPPSGSPITDPVVRRLIHGNDADDLALYDVSDCHLYDRRYRRNLTGELAANAKSAGYEPIAYQAVLWFCVIYMPVWPLGTFFVMPFVEYDDSHDDAVRYRGVRTTRDTYQIACHYLTAATLIAAVLTAIWYCCI